MNLNHSPVPPAKPRFPAHWLVLTLLALLLAAGWGLVRSFRVTGDTAALRAAVLASGPARWDRQFDVGVGWLMLTLGRVGLSFIDLPAEARAAIQAVRRAEVSIHRHRLDTPAADPATLLAAAERAMSRRGWERIVTAQERGELVVVFVPTDMDSARQARFTVLVAQEDELVIASARANLEPLIELGLERLPQHALLR